ncbi:unnamed protein product [Dibothriocephalus latus]|uniref:SUN domain-containing protein n=1 Tax=Dibothriocephalus latus TaxID=60516 RepID=A0A3P7L6I6_DIBLA|nr:unnamed protein product [Dibothriocephalus latus]
MLDHYGSEHFCPITMVRLFGLVSDDLDDAAAEAEGGVGHVPDAVPSIAPAEPRHDQLKEPGSVEKPTSEKKPEVDLKSPQNSVTVPQDTPSGATTILDSSPPPVQPSKDVPVTDPNPAAASPKHRVGGAQNSVKSPDVKYRPVKRLPPNKRTEARKKYPRTAASDASATQGRTHGLEPALGFLQKATSMLTAQILS